MADKKHCDNCDGIIPSYNNNYKIKVCIVKEEREIGVDKELCDNCEGTLTLREIVNMIPNDTGRHADNVPF